jgi:hypothetical protein
MKQIDLIRVERSIRIIRGDKVILDGDLEPGTSRGHLILSVPFKCPQFCVRPFPFLNRNG